MIDGYVGRYYDVINGSLPEPEPVKTEEEIVRETMQGGGLHFKGQQS